MTHKNKIQKTKNAKTQPLKWPTKALVALPSQKSAVQCALENFDQSVVRMESSTQIPACSSTPTVSQTRAWKLCQVSTVGARLDSKKSSI